MPPFRIPFTSKKPAATSGVYMNNNENSNPNGLESKDKPSLALGMKEKKDEPNEFQLSSVNDSGEYMPPSPVEQRSFWGGKSPSTASTHRSVFSQDEPFSISRESFDSYRRSFDITGRSPIIHSESYNSRTSLDSRRLPRAALSGSTFEKPSVPPIDDAAFEDVGLNDDPAKPKKRSFLSRFGDSSSTTTAPSEDSKVHHFHILPGRKRGQSGVGSELGSMTNGTGRPASKGTSEVAVK